MIHRRHTSWSLSKMTDIYDIWRFFSLELCRMQFAWCFKWSFSKKSMLLSASLSHWIITQVLQKMYILQILLEPTGSYPGFKYAACKFFPLNCRVTHHRHLIVPRKDSTWHIFKAVQVWFSEEIVIFRRLLLARFQSYGQNGPFREELKLPKVWISCLFKCWNYPGLTGGGLVLTRYNLFLNSLLDTFIFRRQGYYALDSA